MAFNFNAPGHYCEIKVTGVRDRKALFEIVCRSCGGWGQTLRGEMNDNAMVHCSSCGTWLGRLSYLRFRAHAMAEHQGLDVDMSGFGLNR